MKEHMKNKVRMLFLVLVCVIAGILSGCAPDMKETTVQGFDSAISLKLPGEAKKDDMKFPLDPTMSKFVKGQQIYRVDDNNLSVVLFTMSVDTEKFVGISGKDLSVSMEGPVNSYVKAILSSMKAKDVKQEKADITISGQPAVVRTLTFKADDKNMGIKVVAFQNKDAYWMIIPVYQTGDKDVEKAADDLVKSIAVK
jgi:hypothetical protein